MIFYFDIHVTIYVNIIATDSINFYVVWPVR